MLNGVCVPVHDLEPAVLPAGEAAWGSIGACCASAVRKVSSTTTSAARTPASTSPWRSRKRWQTFVPCRGRMPKYARRSREICGVSWTSGAPGAKASTASKTAGSSS